MKRLIFSLATVAAFAGSGILAQEEVEGGETGEVSEGSDEAASEELEKRFFTLPTCSRIDGIAEVCKPGSSEWQAAEEGKFYPLGSSFRTVGEGSRIRVKFGIDSEVSVADGGSFSTVAQGLGVPTRTVKLGVGTLKTKFAANFPADLFFVTAPGITLSNFRGEAKIDYAMKDGDGDEVLLGCVSGSFCVSGRHFASEPFSAGNEVKIRTSQDVLFTGLYGMRGDVTFKLDQGQIQKRDLSTGEYIIEDKVLEWVLSPQTVVRIHRAVPKLGSRLAVTTLTFDSAGQLRNRCAFTEKNCLINSGEIGPSSRKQREELAKRAAEASAALESEAAVESPSHESAPATGASASASDDEEF